METHKSEEIKQQKIDAFIKNLEKMKDAEHFAQEKESIVKDYKQLTDALFLAKDIRGLRAHQQKKTAKQFLIILCSFVVGIAVAIIPALLYVHEKTSLPKYTFTPDVWGIKKITRENDLIETAEELAKAKTADLVNKEYLQIGSTIGFNPGEGLFVGSKIAKDEYTVEEIKHHKTDIVSGNYTFTGKQKIHVKPRMLDLIRTQYELDIAKQIKGIESKKSLDIGAAIAKKIDGGFYAVPKEKIASDYTLKDLVEVKK